MNTRVAIVLYLTLCAAVAAGVVYLVTDAGHSFWLAVALAFLLFTFVNGSLAYVFRARQLRREGKQPPSYLVYLFFPKGVRQTVAVPRTLRVLLGIVISLGGAFFLIAGGLMLTGMEFSKMPHPIGAVGKLLVLVILGAAFAYVGFRLIIVKNDEPLFRRRKTRSSQIDAA